MIENEHTKLLANALDRASTACLAIGIFAPVAGVIQAEALRFTPGLAVSLAGWFAAAIVLHLSAADTSSRAEAMTPGWFIFGVVMPAIVAGLAVLAMRGPAHALAAPAGREA